MPAARNATYLVGMVRDRLQVYGTEMLRDGFSTDPVTQRRTSILRFINASIAQFAKVGYNLCWVYISAGDGIMEYGLPDDIWQVRDIYWDNVPIEKITVAELFRRYPQAGTTDSYASGDARVAAIESDILYLYPRPDADDVGYPVASSATSSIKLYAEVVPSDLSSPTDVPTRIPNLVHEDLAIVAAFDLAKSLVRVDPSFGGWIEANSADYLRAYNAIAAAVNQRSPSARGIMRPSNPSRRSMGWY
jgi:hypothetical protein